MLKRNGAHFHLEYQSKHGMCPNGVARVWAQRTKALVLNPCADIKEVEEVTS